MSTAFYSYGADELERQYNPPHWPITQISEDWSRKSEDTRRRTKVMTDIAYGPGEREKIDLLLPSDPKHAPALLFIHGGYWIDPSYNKFNYSFCMEPLIESGVIVAMVEYELCPKVTLDIIVNQVQSACAWLWRNITCVGGDPRRLHVVGHSAGGHLAAMLAATDWPKFDPELPLNMIQSTMSISGVFDLDPIRLTTLNAELQLEPAMAYRNSPIFLRPPTGRPVSIVVGGGETDEFRRQSRALADKWRTAVGVLSYFETAGHDHFGVIESMTDTCDPVMAILLKNLGVSQSIRQPINRTKGQV